MNNKAITSFLSAVASFLPDGQFKIENGKVILFSQKTMVATINLEYPHVINAENWYLYRSIADLVNSSKIGYHSPGQPLTMIPNINQEPENTKTGDIELLPDDVWSLILKINQSAIFPLASVSKTLGRIITNCWTQIFPELSFYPFWQRQYWKRRYVGGILHRLSDNECLGYLNIKPIYMDTIVVVPIRELNYFTTEYSYRSGMITKSAVGLDRTGNFIDLATLSVNSFHRSDNLVKDALIFSTDTACENPSCFAKYHNNNVTAYILYHNGDLIMVRIGPGIMNTQTIDKDVYNMQLLDQELIVIKKSGNLTVYNLKIITCIELTNPPTSLMRISFDFEFIDLAYSIYGCRALYVVILNDGTVMVKQSQVQHDHPVVDFWTKEQGSEMAILSGIGPAVKIKLQGIFQAHIIGVDGSVWIVKLVNDQIVYYCQSDTNCQEWTTTNYFFNY